VALVGDMRGDEMRDLLGVLHQSYWPHTVVAFKSTGNGATAPDLPLLQGRDQVEGKATAYVCENFACKLPVTDAASLRQQLEAR
jgi:hypothetical protein